MVSLNCLACEEHLMRRYMIEKQKRTPVEKRFEQSSEERLLREALMHRVVNSKSRIQSPPPVKSSDSMSSYDSAIDQDDEETFEEDAPTAGRVNAQGKVLSRLGDTPDLFIGIPEVFTSEDELNAKHPLYEFMPDVAKSRMRLIGESTHSYPKCFIHLQRNNYVPNFFRSKNIYTHGQQNDQSFQQVQKETEASEERHRKRINGFIDEANTQILVEKAKIEGKEMAAIVGKTLEAAIHDMLYDDSEFQSAVRKEKQSPPCYFRQMQFHSFEKISKRFAKIKTEVQIRTSSNGDGKEPYAPQIVQNPMYWKM